MVAPPIIRLSPPLCLAVPALVFFYAASRAGAGFLLPTALVLLALFSLSLTLRLLPGDPADARRGFFLACVFFGAIAGCASAFRFRSESAGIATLAPLARVVSIEATLLSDPAPAGTDMHYAVCRLECVRCADGSSFSAVGSCTVFLSERIARSGAPGSLSGASDRPVYLSSGVRAAFSGSFNDPRARSRAAFRASGVDAASASWNSPLDRARAGLRLSLTRRLWEWGDAGGFLLALLSGNRDYLDPSLASDFKNTGLSHILALSGMHLSLLSLVAVRFGKRIGGKRVSIRLSLVAILFFVWFAGFSPSLSRAFIMALMLMALGRLGFECAALDALALTAFAQLVWNPADAMTVAFLLSYGALAGIMTFGSCLLGSIPARGRNAVSDGLCESLGAQLATSPITAVVFGSIAPVGVVASCVAGPLSSVFMVAGMALIAVSAAIPPLSAACGSALDVLYRVMAGSVRLFAPIPPLSITSRAGTILACAIPIAFGLSIMTLARAAVKRRSVDDLFARL